MSSAGNGVCFYPERDTLHIRDTVRPPEHRLMREISTEQVKATLSILPDKSEIQHLSVGWFNRQDYQEAVDQLLLFPNLKTVDVLFLRRTPDCGIHDVLEGKRRRALCHISFLDLPMQKHDYEIIEQGKRRVYEFSSRQGGLEQDVDHWKMPEFCYKALCLQPLNQNDTYALFCPPLYLGARKDVEAETRRSYRNVVLNSNRAEERKANARKYLNSAST